MTVFYSTECPECGGRVTLYGPEWGGDSQCENGCELAEEVEIALKVAGDVSARNYEEKRQNEEAERIAEMEGADAAKKAPASLLDAVLGKWWVWGLIFLAFQLWPTNHQTVSQTPSGYEYDDREPMEPPEYLLPGGRAW